MQTTRVFELTSEAWLKKPRYVSSCGGTRSGKTFSIIQMLILLLLGEEKRGAAPTITSVVSESLPHLKRGCIRDFKAIMQGEGIWDESKWNETDKTYTASNGSVLEFFSVDNAGKVFGASRDVLFINECQHIKNYEIFRQLAVRTRGRIILDYNPTHSFWANEKIESRDDCVTVHSTYKDNDFLTATQITEIEASQNDANWWRVFGLGLTGKLDGLIYDFEQIDKLPEPLGLVELYGLDFGFVNDPTALVHILADTKRKHAYIDESCYRTGMLNRDIAALMQEQGIKKGSVEIFADCAEPKSIAELCSYGYNVKPCYKGTDLTAQISFVKGWKIYATKRSLDTLKESRNYSWAKDKDGRDLNTPIDRYNHAMDALRYGLFTKFGNFRRPTNGGTPRQSAAW